MSDNVTTSKSRSRKFINDLGIYAIGNIGAKAVTFLLVPFYTFFITEPSKFGYYDICLNVALALGPLLSLQLNEGAFRMLIGTTDRTEQRSIIAYTYSTLFRNAMIVIFVGIILSWFASIQYIIYIVAYTVTQATYDTSIQILRGLGRTGLFMRVNIYNAVSLALISVLTVALIGMGIPGIFIANISARLIMTVLILFKLNIGLPTLISTRTSQSLRHELLRYSLPLLPTVMLWWVLNSNSLFFIKHYLGLEENGQYAVLTKFSFLLFTIATIFYQTWQQNALEQYNSPDRDSFFSKIFNSYLYIFCGLTTVAPFIIRLSYPLIISTEYQPSSAYMYCNSIFVMTCAMANFFELGYQCSKNTRRLLPSILLATLLNLTGNYLLIPFWGLYGVIASGTITYIIALIYRVIDTRKYMTITFDKRNIKVLLALAGGLLVYQSTSDVTTDIAAVCIFSIIFIIFAPNQLKEMTCHRLRLKR